MTYSAVSHAVYTHTMHVDLSMTSASAWFQNGSKWSGHGFNVLGKSAVLKYYRCPLRLRCGCAVSGRVEYRHMGHGLAGFRFAGFMVSSCCVTRLSHIRRFS